MSYRVERNGDEQDLVFEGWESGIAPSPHKGVANIKNGNISTATGEVTASFSRAKNNQTAITNGTLTTVGSNSNLFTSSSPLKAGQWINISSVTGIKKASTSATVTALTIGGGGAGGASNTSGGSGAGGNAGTVTANTYTVAATAYTITVGAAGAGIDNSAGGTGGTSSFGALATAAGGTGGVQGTVGVTFGAGGTGSGGAGTSGSGTTGGTGGIGTASSITGASVTRAAGGGGAATGTRGFGGSSIGGNGGVPSLFAATAGTTNTGSGGGGNSSTDTVKGADGGSGVVIISYTTGVLTATGGNITTSGGSTIHTFNSSGTFTVTGITDLNFSSGTYYVSYADTNGQVKLSSYYDPTATVSVNSFTTGGTATFSTTPNMGSPVAKAIEKYNTASTVYYRYYILDSQGLVWVYDTGVYATTLISFGVGVDWFLPDSSTSYWTGSTPSGLGILNGWLLVFAGNTVLCKETVNLGDTTTNTTTYRRMRLTTSASSTDAYLMSQASTTNTHFVLVGHQGRADYTDGNFIGSIFPNTSLLTGAANIQSYASYTAVTNIGTVSALVGGSAPFIDGSVRFPVVFFPSTGGTIASALTADTIFWIGDYSGVANTFRVYAAATGGAPLNIQTGATGTQYFNSFFPVGDDASAGATHSTVTFSPQRLNLPFSEIAQTMVEIGNYVLIGCVGNIVYPWNQVDALPSGLIALPEAGVTAMVTVNQMAYILAGNNGNVYITDGSTASLVLNVPDYCAGVPGSPGTYIEPNYYWGDIMYLRGRVYFSVRDQTATKTGNCGGIWSFVPTQNLYIGQDTGIALRLEAENSYLTYNGVATLLLPSQVQDTSVPLYWSGWYSDITTPTYGIDYSNGGTLAGATTVIETDLAPVGTFLNKKTFKQIEYKLAAPLDVGATVMASYRTDGTSAWTALGTFNTDSNALSGYVAANFQKTQWLQLQITLTPITSSADTNTFVRFREIRIR